MRRFSFLTSICLCLTVVVPRSPADQSEIATNDTSTQKARTHTTSHDDQENDVPRVPRPDSLKQVEWRRTSEGWLPLESLMAHRPTQSWTAASRLHPLAVGMFLFLSSIGILLFFDDEKRGSFFSKED